METITVSPDELKKLMREAFIDVSTERRDLIEDAVVEAIEDIGLGMAMEEGRTGEYVDADKFVLKLERKIRGFEVKFRLEKSFDRDADRVKDKKVLRKLRDLLSTIENAEAIQEIPHAKKLEGEKNEWPYNC